ncbi:hypothetical protein FAZ98_11890 [Paraburkholderia acidisoli]|uniref:Uncharacterized protein n=1 Tax=Paraburkholderia acidisoli TaxID=2571748 RepID=A0A7Z2GIE9_9BURK|nr:hypothetical protein FAZ98_11890 [Paraburkholderia acidisoli]
MTARAQRPSGWARGRFFARRRDAFRARRANRTRSARQACDRSLQTSGQRVREGRYLFIIKAILKDSKVVVCWIVRGFARTSASSS